MKITIISILGMLLISGCGQELGNYYFEFDHVDYFTIDLDEYEILQNEDKPNLSSIEKAQIELILGTVPNSISDTSFVQHLEKMGFAQKQIDSQYIKDFKGLFRVKSHENPRHAKCVPVYRDILIFRKNNEISGLAKICFDCGQNHMVGTDENTFDFGQSGDYSKLYRLLKN